MIIIHFAFSFLKNNFFFQIKDTESITYIKLKKEDNQKLSSNFLLSLRKHINTSKLLDIEILNNDRIFKFIFEKINLKGERELNYLIFEMMGRHSNIFLLDENEKILHLFKHNISIENKRFYSIGMNYEIFKQEKQNLDFETKYENFTEMIENISGIGKIFAIDTFDNLSLRKKYTKKYIPSIYYNNNKYILSYQNFTSFKNMEMFSYNTLNEALNIYFEEFSNISITQNMKKNIIKNMSQKIQKNEKIMSKIKNDISKSNNFEEYKKIGDLLAINLHLIKPFQEKLKVLDYDSNNLIEINLDKNKNASQNMNIYYNKYRKAKKSIEIGKERLDKLKEENEYYESVISFTNKENDIYGLSEISEEIGLIKIDKKQKEKNKRDLLKYDIEGFEVYVGRNNKENDYITFEKGKSEDIWLHAKDIPGSHVLIVTNKRNVPENVILEAAKLASINSKYEGKKKIDYCKRKNVKRLNHYGKVTFTNNKTIEI